MERPTILIAGGDGTLLARLRRHLARDEFVLIEAASTEEIWQRFQEGPPDVAILDSSPTGGWDGLEVAEHIRHEHGAVPIILITGESSEARAIAALKIGINDYFKVPFSSKELLAGIRRSLPRPPQRSRTDRGLGALDLKDEQGFVGENRRMQEVKAYLLRVAQTDCNCLITGETGTGKELVAGLIHQHSSRRGKPLVSINCSALPDGLLESELFGHEKGAFTGADSCYAGRLKVADEGTVLLDEIGDMSRYTQAKILRAVEGKEVYPVGGRRGVPLNIRILAATNQDLEDLVEEGTFRKDLYFRLNVARIDLPPLRDRKEDIPLLLDHYIAKLNRQFARGVEGLTDEAFEVLLRYDWPGNVRELKNVLVGTFIDHPPRRIALWHLPRLFLRRLEGTKGLPRSERERLLAALYSTNWNKSKAAEQLQWSRMTVYRKMAKYNILEDQPHRTVPP